MEKVREGYRILVVGTESSGSVFVSRVVANVVGVSKFKSWDGYGIIRSGKSFVQHTSFPTGKNSDFLNIDVGSYTHIVITIRCPHASIESKWRRWGKEYRQSVNENKEAARRIIDIINSGANFFIFSYEAMLLLDVDYLKRLYLFLGVSSSFSPNIKDGNAKYYNHG